jgi:hypothetical protein
MLGQAAPWPAAKMSGLHSETIGLDASSSLAQIMVRLEGPRDADKRVMMERCMQIAEQKLQISRLSGGLNVVQGIQVADHFGPEVNAVEVRATARHVAGDGAASSASDGKLSLGAMVMQEMGTPLVLPDYNDQQSLLYGPYGTASIATLFACFLQDPCNIQSTTPGENPTPDSGKDDSTTKKKKSDQQPTAFAFTGDPSSAFKAPAYSSDHEAGIYTFARVETIVNKRPMRVALPIAGDPNDKKNAKKDTVFIATLGLPISYLNVKIQLERNADWPKILTDADFTDSNGIKYSLINPGSIYNSRAPQLQGTGIEKMYALDAEFEYAMSRPLATDETFPVSSLPWDNIPSMNNKMAASNFIAPSDAKGIK